MPEYRDIETEAPDYEPLPFYSSEVDTDLDLAEWLRDTSAVPGAAAEPAYTAGLHLVTEPAAPPAALEETGTGEV